MGTFDFFTAWMVVIVRKMLLQYMQLTLVLMFRQLMVAEMEMYRHALLYRKGAGLVQMYARSKYTHSSKIKHWTAIIVHLYSMQIDEYN